MLIVREVVEYKVCNGTVEWMDAEGVVVSREVVEDGNVRRAEYKCAGRQGSVGATDAFVATPVVAASAMMSASNSVSNSHLIITHNATYMALKCLVT